ncbi:P-II family nitrogen regulator [Collimonas silvisoli]|uniref:P-II family nitrogen regulator n=1 Tax=Collimonas silvisoli TaxID=2825884 RepID=UPI001B8B463A|nr:P-II family nitrogen regulator [Collimonas silvisoli]
MNVKYVIAIIRPDALLALEARLGSLHMQGMTVTKVKGYGEYTDFYSKNHLTEHLKVEIFVDESKLEALTNAILDVAHSDIPGAGILAVLAVDEFFHIRTRSEF